MNWTRVHGRGGPFFANFRGRLIPKRLDHTRIA